MKNPIRMHHDHRMLLIGVGAHRDARWGTPYLILRWRKDDMWRYRLKFSMRYVSVDVDLFNVTLVIGINGALRRR